MSPGGGTAASQEGMALHHQQGCLYQAHSKALAYHQLHLVIFLGQSQLGAHPCLQDRGRRGLQGCYVVPVLSSWPRKSGAKALGTLWEQGVRVLAQLWALWSRAEGSWCS